MGFDWYYLVLVVPAMLLALWAQFKVNTPSAGMRRCRLCAS